MRRGPVARPGQAVYSQNKYGYGVQDVGGEDVGMKCGGMQRCCEGAMPGVRAQRGMEQVLVAVTTKTNRVGAVARQSYVSPPRAHD